MKLFSIFFAAASGLALTASVAAAPITFKGTLSNVGEALPQPSAIPSAGTGSVTVIFDDTAHTLNVDVTFSGLTGTTTAAHIHCCTALPNTGNSGVATEVPSFVGFPLGVRSGHYIETFDLSVAPSFNPAFITASSGTVAGAEARLGGGLGSGNAYLNIHTSAVPSGEIRAFFTRVVPEPQTLVLMLFGISAMGLMRRNRRV